MLASSPRVAALPPPARYETKFQATTSSLKGKVPSALRRNFRTRLRGKGQEAEQTTVSAITVG